MANSTAPVYFKPTVAFNRGDTFVFGASVCTADGAGSFHRRISMQPNPETGFVTLPEVVTGVGDSPRGPLKQLGNPHLKPATEPKPNTPRLTMQDTAHDAETPTAH
jgi:hypothetical protein